MRRIVLVMLVLSMWSLTVAAAQPQQKKSDQKVLADARKCVQPWLDGINYIFSSITMDDELKGYQEIVSNYALARPVETKKGMGVEYLASSPNRDKDWIGLAPVCSQSSLPEVWKKHFSSSNFLAQIDSKRNVIWFRGDINVPKLLRGLVFLHELRHGVQTRYPRGDEDNAEYQLFKEVDAYDYEFKLLDRLNPKGYRCTQPLFQK